MPTAPRRDHLIDTALTLFAAEGYHAVGIDRILAEAGVAKMTLYKHFRSKDELILATLRKRDSEYRNWLAREVEKTPPTKTAGRLVAYLDAVERWSSRPAFNGCAFVNAASEFANPEHPIHRAAADHKTMMFAYVEDLARNAGAQDPHSLALQIRALAEGAVVLKQTTRSVAGFAAARAAVAVLFAQNAAT